MTLLSHLKLIQSHNLHTLRTAPLSEISGSLGDLGTLLPILIALSLQTSISLPSSLIFSGLFNILTGILFGIPLPVQPMKAIAAAALASSAAVNASDSGANHHDSAGLMNEVLAAGALVSAAVGILSITGLLRWLSVWIPVPVVKGIQVGAGVSLVVSAAGKLIGPLGWTDHWLDNRIWAVGAFVLLLFTTASTATTMTRTTLRRVGKFPYALVVFGVGLVLAFVAIAMGRSEDGQGHKWPHFEIWRPRVYLPRFVSEKAWEMAVGQLPLTTLNSVIAVAALATELFPKGSLSVDTPSVTQLGLSVAGMNLVGCWFGAMPVCHGAGGLAAQYKFGARSGASIVLLGLVKLLLGLFFGSSLSNLLAVFPKSILGIMVIAAGLELAKVGQSLNDGATDLWEESVDVTVGHGIQRKLSAEERVERWMVMLVTAAGILAFQNDAVGLVAGLLTHASYVLAHRYGGRHGAESQPLLS